MKKSILLFVVISVLIFALAGCGDKGEPISWDALFLGAYLPETEAPVGKIRTNDDDSLGLTLYEMSEQDYSAYVISCRNFGYTVDDDKSGSSFTAFNEEGYKIDLWYLSSSKELRIDLEMPMEMTELTWPSSDVAQSIPLPESGVGQVDSDTDRFFTCYVGEMSKEAYADYVDTCMEKGFDVEYDRGEDYFHAENEDGISLRAEYRGANVIFIRVDAAKEEASVTTPTTEPTKPTETVPETTEKPTEAVPETTEKPKDKDDEKLGKEFKEAMDAYEEFFDEYVAFMKEYQKNPTDLKLLGKYTTIMTEYTKMMKEMEEWEDEDLNKAETLYYVEVTQRISRKLLEVAL